MLTRSPKSSAQSARGPCTVYGSRSPSSTRRRRPTRRIFNTGLHGTWLPRPKGRAGAVHRKASHRSRCRQARIEDLLCRRPGRRISDELHRPSDRHADRRVCPGIPPILHARRPACPLTTTEVEEKFRDNALYGGWSTETAGALLGYSRSIFEAPISSGWRSSGSDCKHLKGRVAIVTGAARNIGRAIALELAREGAAVVVNARNSSAEAEAVASEIRSAGGRGDRQTCRCHPT